MSARPRYIPCPYCKGSGGHEEAFPGLGCGPFYDCTACGGEGSLDGYRAEQKRLEEKHLAESEVICADCGHEAGRHYDGHDGCGFDWREAEFIHPCGCKRSREAVMKANVHTLLSVVPA